MKWKLLLAGSVALSISLFLWVYGCMLLLYSDPAPGHAHPLQFAATVVAFTLLVILLDVLGGVALVRALDA